MYLLKNFTNVEAILVAIIQKAHFNTDQFSFSECREGTIPKFKLEIKSQEKSILNLVKEVKRIFDDIKLSKSFRDLYKHKTNEQFILAAINPKLASLLYLNNIAVLSSYKMDYGQTVLILSDREGIYYKVAFHHSNWYTVLDTNSTREDNLNILNILNQL